MRTRIFCLSIISVFLVFNESIAQETSNWDNQLYLINKVNWGKDQWRFSGELQGRIDQNMRELQQYHVEFVASYLLNENWEIVPDFRFTVKPEVVEYRPGFGVFYKNMFKKSQLVHQLKGQLDIEGTGYTSYATRYALFYHKRLSDKLVGSVFGGGLYEIGQDFTGWWGFRFGTNLTLIIDKVHRLTFGYMYGAVNLGTEYTNIGILNVGLFFNLKKDYTYQPARYISF